MNALNLALIHALCCFVAGREISKTLKVNNGGPWGQWQQDDFCPVNSYAIGYEMKVSEYSFALLFGLLRYVML